MPEFQTYCRTSGPTRTVNKQMIQYLILICNKTPASDAAVDGMAVDDDARGAGVGSDGSQSDVADVAEMLAVELGEDDRVVQEWDGDEGASKGERTPLLEKCRKNIVRSLYCLTPCSSLSTRTFRSAMYVRPEPSQSSDSLGIILHPSHQPNIDLPNPVDHSAMHRGRPSFPVKSRPAPHAVK